MPVLTAPAPALPGPPVDTGTDPDQTIALARLWKALLSARVGLALALVAAAVLASHGGSGRWVMLGCAVYAALAIYARWQEAEPGSAAELASRWPRSVGIDALTFALLHAVQFVGLNFAPLFILPVLTAAMMGTGLLSLATAAGVSIFLLAEAWWSATAAGLDSTARLLQAGLYGMGFFGVAIFAHALAARLVAEEATARSSDLLARMQIRVNQLVIDSMSDGVLVVDGNGVVRSLNPAAQRLILGAGQASKSAPFVLAGDPACQPLAQLAMRCLQEASRGDSQPVRPTIEVQVQHTGEPPRRLLVQASVVLAASRLDTALCVMHLEDLRDLEARVRKEKLAAMGRMSAAVAHEIRNPLAAISQANALLAESVQADVQHKLTGIVADNSRRLGRIVDEVLSVSRVDGSLDNQQLAQLELRSTVQAICNDWAQQNMEKLGPAAQRLMVQALPEALIRFDADHLRQVLVNLLDNAERHGSQAPGAIRVMAGLDSDRASVAVWSDGPSLDAGVEEHLFEPFFSSHSRSSGLGLYICRELCERHGAGIAYRRVESGPNWGSPSGGGNLFELECQRLGLGVNQSVGRTGFAASGFQVSAPAPLLASVAGQEVAA